MNEAEYLKQLFDERFDRDKERLDKDEKLIEELSACNIKLTAMIEAHEKQLDAYNKRLAAIEAKPAERWNNVVKTVLSTVAAAVAGFFLAKMGM